MKHTYSLAVFLATSLFCFNINAQKVRLIDNKGTIVNFNNNRVFEQNNDPKSTSTVVVERDIWINNNAGNSFKVLQKDGSWKELISKEENPTPDKVISNSTPVAERTLNSNDYRVNVISTEGGSINLPDPSNTNKGKVYIIENNSGNETNVYIEWGNDDENTITLNKKKVIIIQSDGEGWYQIN